MTLLPNDELLQQFYLSCREPLIFTDETGKIRFANPAALTFFGYSHDELIGESVTLLIPQEHHEQHHIFQKEYFKKPESRARGTGLKLSATHKNGQYLPVDISLCPLEDNAMIAVLIRDVRKNRSIEEKLYFLAHHDHLTGLLNTEALYAELGKLIREKNIFSIFLIDIDNFKKVNDSFGHAQGNQLLISFCNRLKTLFDQNTLLARIGGDEFVCIIPLTHLNQAQPIAQKVLAALRLPYDIGHLTISLSVSIGISLFPKDSFDGETLLACADQAMYRVKKRGKNNFSF